MDTDIILNVKNTKKTQGIWELEVICHILSSSEGFICYPGLFCAKQILLSFSVNR